MKKTLSLVLAVLMLLSVFAVTSFAADAPVVSGITCTFDGISITWEKSADAVAYLVYRDDACIATTTECQFVDTTVEANKTYVYNVAAQAKDGSIAQTEIGFDITYIRPYCAHENCTEIIDYPATVFEAGLKHKHCNDCGLDLAGQVIKQLVPATPVINYLSNGVDGIKVSWNLVDGASAYYLYRRAGGSSKWVGPFKVKGNSYEDTSAESGVYYKYAVRAVNNAGLSPYNGGKVIKRVDTPELLSVANTEGGIYFKWNAIANATSYRVYRKLAEDSSWTYITTVKKTYYADLDVTSGTDYVYTVRAVSNNVYSNFVPGVKIRRLDLPELNGTKSTAEGVYIDFEPVEGATGYNIYRKTGNGPWTSQSYLGAIKTTRSHTYLDVSAKKGVTYTYTVKAYYKDGSTTSVSAYTVKGTSCKDVY